MKRSAILSLLPVYAAILGVLIFTAFLCSKGVTVISENLEISRNHCVIIDAGHGGIDGGATSYTGVLESNINLEIARRLNDLMHLLGLRTTMIRTTDTSVYTEGASIAAKKVSDLKQRVKIVNETENALLISIHQNYYPDQRYAGAQVFYPRTEGSEALAKKMQSTFVDMLNPGSRRKAKFAEGIYLMNKIKCTGVLVECGFLSNPEEEAKLRKKYYQIQICCVIASCCVDYFRSAVA